MQKTIQSIAVVRSGAYLKEVPVGAAHYLQVNLFDKEAQAFLLTKPTLELDSKVEKHLLQEGDIVFAAKGTSNFCSVFHQEAGAVVASSSFLVIRCMNLALVSPEYLCWFLNRRDSMAYLKANAIGTSIPSISKALVESFKISIPSMRVQEMIVAIAHMQQREEQLNRKILELRNYLTERRLIEIVNKCSI